MAANDEVRTGVGAAEREFESTASSSSSGRNPSAFNDDISPNANGNSVRSVELQQMELLMAAMQKLSAAVDSNTSAIRDMQQNQQVREFMPSRRLRTSPTSEDKITCNEPQQQRAFDIFVPSPSDDQRSSSSDSCSSSSSSSGESNPDEGLDRKTVRLDGLEVYAVVSAVTAGTLVAVFDSYHPGDILDLFASGRWLELCLSLVFTAVGGFGIVCGLHCIFVFSLITMYGRTALGMERDDALEIFFSGTGLQRYHGFKTFVASLYSLGTCLLVVIASKISLNPAIHLLALTASAKLMHYVYMDTQSIMSKATVIFAPPSSPAPSISSSHKIDEANAVVEVEEVLHSEHLETSAEEKNSTHQQVIASADEHHSPPPLPRDDATKSQSATTDGPSSKKDKQQNRSRRRRSSLGLSAADHIAIEEQKCTGTTTKKHTSAMTLSATDLMGADAGISRSSSVAVSSNQKIEMGKAVATRSANITENSDHGNKRGVEEPTGTGNAASRSSVESDTCNGIQNLVQQKDFWSVWKAAAAVATAVSNEEGNTDDSSDKSTEIKGLAHLLALKEEGWQQQAWLDLKQAVAHAHNQHHHGQHHGKRRASSAMNQSAVDHIHMDAAGGVHGTRRAPHCSSRAA